MRKFTFMWFIQNCSYCWHKAGEALESPTFFAEIMHRTSWRLHLYPRGKADLDSIALYLKRSDNCNGPETVALHYELSFLDANGKVIEKADSGEGEFAMTKNESFGLSDFLERPAYPTDIAFDLDVLRVCCTMLMGEGEIEKETLSYAKTRLGREKISFVNTIEHFTALEANRKTPLDETTVSEDLIVSGNVCVRSDPDAINEVTVGISLDSQNAHLIACQMYIRNSAGEEVECGKMDTRNEICTENTLSTSIKFGNKSLLDKKDEYLPDDKLTLRCECTLSTGIEFEEIESTFHDLHLTPLVKERIHNKNFAAFPTEPRAVLDDLRSLLQNRIHSDIKLEIGGKEFAAHKGVLSARSPVFKSMLVTEGEEELGNIKLDDLDVSIVNQFLLFLYTDILDDFDWENMKKLYSAASNYRVQRLKDMCTSFLMAGLNSTNMCGLLILADKHQDLDLKRGVQNFICKKDKKIFCTNEWEGFMERNRVLALDTMYFYMKNSSLCI